MKSAPGTADHAADLKFAVRADAMVPNAVALVNTSRVFQLRATPFTTEPMRVQPPSLSVISQYTCTGDVAPAGSTSYSPDASDGAAACSALQLGYSTQLPLTQRRELPHTVPHAPQFNGSLAVSRHDPEHTVCPVAHAVVHVLLTHTRPAPHALPHVPQFALSLAVSRHTPEHTICPVGHDSTHIPVRHTVPAEHTVPHAPQLFGSTCVLAHVDPAPVPHWVSPDGQSSTQRPPVHTLPDGHIEPHPPQLSRSVSVDTQRPPHTTCPVGHDSTQVPDPQS